MGAILLDRGFLWCPNFTDVDNVQLVRDFLRAQNLEQVGRVDEAIELYERMLDAGFDATGPYDRLIALYGDRALHAEVARVADTALAKVQTHPEKRGWYERMKADAGKAAAKVPKAAPRPEK
jgi:pentatricopeptide repeat protein